MSILGPLTLDTFGPTWFSNHIGGVVTRRLLDPAIWAFACGVNSKNKSTPSVGFRVPLFDYPKISQNGLKPKGSPFEGNEPPLGLSLPWGKGIVCSVMIHAHSLKQKQHQLAVKEMQFRNPTVQQIGGWFRLPGVNSIDYFMSRWGSRFAAV